MNIIEFKNVNKSFPGVKALSNVSFSIKKGEVLALIGENGAGKSTLMKIISGAYSMDEGEVIFDNEILGDHTPKEAEEKGISIIYQELNLINSLSIAENIFLGRYPKKNGLIQWKKMENDAREVFLQFDLNVDVTKQVQSLSVAQKQMVEIAKSMSYEAKIVIMDEPTSSLSHAETELLFEIVRSLKQRDITVVFITHRLDEVYEICDRIVVLRDGQYIGEGLVEDINKAQLIQMMIGRELTNQFPIKDNVIEDEIFRIEDFSDGDRVKNISFGVRKGEVLGLAGLVGAGRTECMRLIFGVDKPITGKVFLEGKEINVSNPRDSIKNNIGFVTENRKEEGLFLTLSVAENIMMAAIDKVKKNNLINYSKVEEVADFYIDRFSIATPSREQMVTFLSGGNQQKVVLAKWLLSDSQVIILDEPTRGIDVGTKYEIYELINTLAKEGKVVIVISSDMEEIMGISDRIVVMCEGVVTGELMREEFDQARITALAVGEKI